MVWLKTAATKLFALFVDDGATALAILVWLSFCWQVLPHLHLAAVVEPIALAAGLAFILLASSLRRAG